MSLRFGSGWLVIYFLICSCTFICSAPQLRARDNTTFNPFEPLPFSVTPDPRGFGSLDRERNQPRRYKEEEGGFASGVAGMGRSGAAPLQGVWLRVFEVG